MIVEFLEEAIEQLTNATIWYEAKKAGLGIRFRDEIARVFNRLIEDPLLWRERSGGYKGQLSCFSVLHPLLYSYSWPPFFFSHHSSDT